MVRIYKFGFITCIYYKSRFLIVYTLIMLMFNVYYLRSDWIIDRTKFILVCKFD